MTDAITVLTTDHRTVDGLFTQVEGQATPPQEVVDRIVKELSVHDAIEKEHLYPAVRQRVEGGAAQADHSIEEHDQVARLLLEIDRTRSGEPGLPGLLAELITTVRAHVQEEETGIFPSLRASVTQADLDALGETLEGAKASAPTRPHPHAPSEGTGTKLAGALSAPLDKARDAIQGRS